MNIFLGVGAFLMVFSMIAFWIRRESEQKELHSIQDKFTKDEW
jgi:hypothetical protein